MSCERENAVVNNEILLRNQFRYSQTNDYFDPYEISKVDILDSDGVTVIESFSGAEIIQDSTGKYHVVAAAIATPKTVYDRWYFTPANGADEITQTNTCVIWAVETGEEYGPELEPSTNSYVTEAEMDDYFLTRFGASEVWDDLTTLQKRSAMITAYKKITLSGYFSLLPDTINQNLRDAQCELALHIVVDGLDTLRRQGLQAQGVIQSGIAKEVYDPETRGKLSFPPEVLALLKEYTEEDNAAFADDLARDDEEDVV